MSEKEPAEWELVEAGGSLRYSCTVHLSRMVTDMTVEINRHVEMTTRDCEYVEEECCGSTCGPDCRE